MRIFQHPGETDCCYVEESGQLYEIDMAGWSRVFPEDGTPPDEWNSIVLDGSRIVTADHLLDDLWRSVLQWMTQREWHLGGE